MTSLFAASGRVIAPLREKRMGERFVVARAGILGKNLASQLHCLSM
jgi:hypothetical protein